MIVLKFGGSSLRSREWILRALAIVERRLPEAPVMVVSAMGDTTDFLQEVIDRAVAGEMTDALRLVEALRERTLHEGLLRQRDREVGRQAAREWALERVERFVGQLVSLTRGVSLIHECTSRIRAAILSYGELLSSTLVSAAARELHIETTLHDSRELIITDDNYEAAMPLYPETADRLRSAICPEAGRLVVLQGFIASTLRSITTSLGRGGSDYTATIVGAALSCRRVEIWTDVDGMMTTDPRLVPEAKTIAHIGYDEAAELAYFGARVVHPYTIQPAIDRDIPVMIRNTGAPERAGTLIAPIDGEADRDRSAHRLEGIASRGDTTVVTIQSYRMLNAYGFLSRIFSVFERHRISVDLIATSEVSVSMTVDAHVDLSAPTIELNRIGRVTLDKGNGIVCLVGRALRRDPVTLSRVFCALRQIPIRLVSLGSSDINLSIVLEERHRQRAVRLLHDEFFR